MQELESIKQVDLQPIQIKQESIDSESIDRPTNNNTTTTITTNSKKIENHFQASLERQRNLLLNMEQITLYPSHISNNSSLSLSNELDNDKVMDIQVDNNLMPILSSRQTIVSNNLPGINELKNLRNATGQGALNFNNTDNLLTSSDKKLTSRSNSMILNSFNNSQLNDDNEFGNFEEDDYGRLTNSTLYDNFDLGNQSIKMEETFHDDKLDFNKTGPTLAELNLNDDDMIDNFSTACVNPNAVLCPSNLIPMQAKTGFLMGIKYTIGGQSNSITTDSTDLVVSNDQFSTNGHSLNDHLKSKSTNASSKNNNSFNRSTNNQQQATEQRSGKQSYNTRKRSRNKSDGDKPSQRRTNNQSQQQQQNNSTNNSSDNNNLPHNNQVLCKLLNEKTDNNSNCIYLVNTNESQLIPNAIISNEQQSIASTSATHLQITTICVSPQSLLSSLSAPHSSITQISSLQNDFLLNQLQATLNQQQVTKCGPQTNLRLNNHSATRNRNSSISTEHSFSSSHDEGFISQAEEDSDEKDDSHMICDSKSQTENHNKQQVGKAKRKRAIKDLQSNLVKNEPESVVDRNLKKIKLEDQSQIKPTTSTGFTSTLSTVREERGAIPKFIPATTVINSGNKIKEEKFGTKGRVNYKITKDKLIPTDLQQTHQSQFNDINSSLIDEKIEDEESSDEDDDSFYGDYDASDLIGATTSDDPDQQNKWSLNMGRSRKNSAQRYFWQYNVQSKGPKGTKLTTTISDNALESDPPTSTPGSDLEPLDPVFSPNCQIEGVKHAGKARRGDGNDLTANPKKLLLIGLELKKLSKIINDLTPVAEVPQNSKSNSRKEKNKLASRACRLKKKAQHEANKIKLHGLSVEYKKLLAVNNEFKKIQEKVCDQGMVTSNKKLVDQLNTLLEEKGPIVNIAGSSTEFVNSILDAVSSGNCSGGLEKLL